MTNEERALRLRANFTLLITPKDKTVHQVLHEDQLEWLEREVKRELDAAEERGYELGKEGASRAADYALADESRKVYEEIQVSNCQDEVHDNDKIVTIFDSDLRRICGLEGEDD